MSKNEVHNHPERRCIATGETLPKAQMIRFVLSPEGRVTPDLAEKLPGRGAWVKAERQVLMQAVVRNQFSRSFKTQVKVEQEIADAVEALLVARVSDMLSLANKAGKAVAGFDKVHSLVKQGMVTLLFVAQDSAASDEAKLDRGASKPICKVRLLCSAELAKPFGRDHLVYAALNDAAFSKNIMKEIRRLAGFRE